jgi:hypothetical protein
MSISQHTSTPWKTKRNNAINLDGVKYRIVWSKAENGSCLDIAYVVTLGPDEGNADAEFIVRAVNAHDSLLAVCKELEESAAYWSEYDTPLGIVDRLRAAIAKAEPAVEGK